MLSHFGQNVPSNSPNTWYMFSQSQWKPLFIDFTSFFHGEGTLDFNASIDFLLNKLSLVLPAIIQNLVPLPSQDSLTTEPDWISPTSLNSPAARDNSDSNDMLDMLEVEQSLILKEGRDADHLKKSNGTKPKALRPRVATQGNFLRELIINNQNANETKPVGREPANLKHSNANPAVRAALGSHLIPTGDNLRNVIPKRQSKPQPKASLSKELARKSETDPDFKPAIITTNRAAAGFAGRQRRRARAAQARNS